MITKRLLVRISLPLLLLIMTQTVLAQKTITGRVTDSRDASPIVGATVQPKGGTGGTSTGNDGSFRITVGNDVSTLVISYIGFGTIETDISGRSSVDIALTASGNNNLNEVIVVGYGTARKKDITGAVVSVKEKDFNRGVITAPDQLIQGKVAGVQMLNNSGQPGGATTVRIRGNASVRSGNQPLYVIDGVPLDNNNARGRATTLGIGQTPGANPINFINPNDIASIDVLKDASATAIYGSRGGNGVILITTKRGLTGAPTISYNGSYGVSNLVKTLKVLDAAEYRAALKSYGITAGGDYGGNVDAMDAILRSGFTQNHNVSMSAGNENARYRFSAGYLNQQGIVRETGFKKYTANLTSSFKFLESKKLALDVNLLASHNIENIAPITNDAGFQGNLIGQALQWNPTHPLRLPNDSIWVNNQIGSTTVNPLAMLAAYDDKSNLTNILASISPSYKFTDALEYKLLFSLRYATGTRQQEIKRWINLDGIRDRGAAAIGNNQLITQQVTNTLSYNKRISEKLDLKSVVGHEYMKFQSRGDFLFGLDFIENGLSYFDFLQYSTTNSRGIETFNDPVSELQSYFGRATIGWDDKYLLTATFRADGSSKFGENNKYGYFPSVGFAWNVINEGFLQNNNVVNNLKFRAGWGITGNQEFPAGASLTRYRFTGPGAAERTNFGNKDLKWERSTTLNLGIDFGFFGDRIFGSVDYFRRKTEDVLFEQFIAQPGPTGNAKYWVNLPGEVENKGVEVALSGVLAQAKDVNWTVGVVASFLKNKLTNFGSQIIETGGLHGQGISGTTIQRLINDQPLNVFYLRQFEGIDKATGQSIYTDGGNTKYYVGSPNPDVVLGLYTEVVYKKWSAYVNMNGAFGHYIYNNTANTVLPIGNLGTRNVASSLIGGEIKENATNAVAASTRFLEKGDYMKLANATISYNLGNVGKTFRGITLSLTGQNLFILTNFTGFDPEVNTDKSVGGVPSFGIEYTAYPSARTILFGINFSL